MVCVSVFMCKYVCIMKGEGIFGGCRVGIWMIWRDRGILVGVGWEFGLFGRFGYFVANEDMS